MTDPTTYHRPLQNAFPRTSSPYSSLYDDEDDIHPSMLTTALAHGTSLKSINTKVAEVEEFKQSIPSNTRCLERKMRTCSKRQRGCWR